jgi:DNA topoisomerase-1
MNAQGKRRLPRALKRGSRLTYVSDQAPGIGRERRGKSFRYVGTRGRLICCQRTVARIRTLAIPPAWTDVWICPDPRGHLQATGRDDRGRKQYIYHSAWQTARNCEKFENLYEFGKSLPRVRRVVARQLARHELDRETLLAAMILLLDRTLVRVGNEEYVRQNDSFGLTTLRDRHAQARGPSLRIRFRGKSGIEHDVRITHRRLARIVRQCQELPGQRLFQYYDESGAIRPVTSGDVNDYLRTLTGNEFTAKEFRTWKATVHVLDCLLPLCSASAEASELAGKRAVKAAIASAAAALGNTVTICRKYYVHPRITELFLAGELGSQAARPRRVRRGLTQGEELLLHILKQAPALAREA